jgi:hypothetical protein
MRLIITMGGVCLNDEEKHQIGFSGMVRAATNTRSRADAALWLLRTSAECYRSRRSPGQLGNVGLIDETGVAFVSEGDCKRP